MKRFAQVMAVAGILALFGVLGHILATSTAASGGFGSQTAQATCAYCH